MIKKALLVAAIALLSANASATTISLLGDKDCFGTGGVCVEDGVTWLPGGWGAVVQGGGDPVWQDTATNTSSPTTYSHIFAPGSYVGALLTIRTLGMGDISGPYSIFADGINVGSIPLDGFGHILVETFSFALSSAIMADGVVSVSWTTGGSDTWAVDYSEITLSSVPEPGTIGVLAMGLLGLAFARRRRV